jgi:hypothetical protein
MTRPLPLNNLQPGRWQNVWLVIRPMLLISIGIHALALLVPLPPKAIDAEKAAQEQAITITQLPPVEQSTAKPAPAPAASTASAKPSLTAVPARPAVINSPSPAVVSSQSTVTTSTPSSGTPSSSTSSSSTPSSGTAPSPQLAAATPVSPSIVDAFPRDFPQYPDAQPGTFGLPPTYEPFSRKTSKAIAEVDEWFQQQLSRQGYTTEPVEQSAQRMVYRVAKGGVTEFLSLIPNAAGGTNILVIPDPLLQSDEQAILPTGDSQFLTDLTVILPTSSTSGWQAISNPTELLAEPTAFFENTAEPSPKLKSGAENAAFIENQDVETVFGGLRPKFQAAEIDVVLQGNYGGGYLYQAIRGAGSHFFSLVPTQDGKSTVIVVWSQSPL